MVYLLAFIGSFVAVGLKGFQHKNVIRNKHTAVFFTSYATAFADVLVIGMIARSGWSIAFAAGSSPALGTLLSIKLHDRLFGSKKGEG